MRLVIRIHLIGTVISVSLISFVVRVMLVSPIIQLLLSVSLPAPRRDTPASAAHSVIFVLSPVFGMSVTGLSSL